MDCRKAAVLALGTWTGLVGCTSFGPKSTVPEVAANTPIEKEADLPKRKPSATICVAFGQLQEQMADDGRRAPVEQERHLERARKFYEQALETEPNNLAALAALARLSAAKGSRERALSYYGKALQAQPKQAGLWYDRGMCHARHKDWEPALQDLHKALELEPTNRRFASAVAFGLARAGRYDES